MLAINAIAQLSHFFSMTSRAPSSFCSFRKIYTGTNSRTLSNLSALYEDSDRLDLEMSTLINLHIHDDYVKGKKVLFKPNWVMHPVSSSEKLCLCTHEAFVLAAIEIILRKSPLKIVVGDAPIQLCDWNALLSRGFYQSIYKLREKYNIDILICDFRRTKFDAARKRVVKNTKPLDQYVIFDLGSDSFLEPVTSAKIKTPFRVTNYNPDRLEKAHRKGMHRYCITKHLFDADIVISLPKIKTHQKTGITGALKNLVGINGDKDFLPHHRLGGTGFGGDCYPGKNYLRLFSELVMDMSNKSSSIILKHMWAYLSKTVWVLSFPKKEHSLAAGWYGNDTTWRMVMDLNRIAVFGKPDGTLSTTPLRSIYSLCDGIVAGQGDGPLSPEPLALGFIGFSNNSAVTDACFGTLIGLDIKKVPLLKAAYSRIDFDNLKLKINCRDVTISDLKVFAATARLPVGWINYKGKHT